MAATGNDAGAPAVGCGAHTATGVPDDARGHLYLYVGGSSGTCTGMDVVRISLTNPSDAVFLRRANANRQCHDNNVIMGTLNLAMCAGGNGFSVFKFDPALPADAPGGIANPTLERSVQVPEIGGGPAHSGSFSYDGKVLIFGWEPGGGTNPRCQANLSTSPNDNLLFFFDPATGTRLGTMTHTRPQSAIENCTWHNFNVVPTYKGYYAVSGNYQKGISVIDFTNPAAATEIAYADPKPFSTNFQPTAGDWSTHFYNGKIYQSDIRRGLIVWDLDHDSMRRVRTPDLSNPQTQTASFAQDLDGPAISIAQPLEGAQFKQGQQHIADFSCTDNDSGVESCVGTVADGAAIDTSKIGYQTFTVTAKDKAGTETTKTVTYVVNSTDVGSTPGGNVPATLALSLGTAPTFAGVHAGRRRDLQREHDRERHLDRGRRADLGRPTRARPTPASSSTVRSRWRIRSRRRPPAPAARARRSRAVGGSAAPTSLLTYTGPKSNDTVTLNFRQTIGRTEALRTGTYSKTLTFTLSTTQP